MKATVHRGILSVLVLVGLLVAGVPMMAGDVAGTLEAQAEDSAVPLLGEGALDFVDGQTARQTHYEQSPMHMLEGLPEYICCSGAEPVHGVQRYGVPREAFLQSQPSPAAYGYPPYENGMDHPAYGDTAAQGYPVYYQSDTLSLSAGMEPLSDAPEPYFYVYPRYNEMRGEGWPGGVLLTITISESGALAYQTDTYSDSWGHFWLSTERFNVKAGQLVTVTDGEITREHTVTMLTVTEVSVENDTVSGTADPGADVLIGLHDAWRYRTVTADSGGNWAADFSEAVGEETWELEYDLSPGSSGFAEEWEGGGSTRIEWRVPDPRLYVDSKHDRIWGHGWPADAVLTISIDDLADLTWDTVVHVGWWGNFHLHLWDFDIQAGHLVTVTDGEITREHTVTMLTITEVNVDEDTISGTAEPGSDVYVNVHGGPSRDLTADAVGGNWIADFSGPSEDGTFDLKPGSSGFAEQWEGGGSTHIEWRVPDPRIYVDPQRDHVWSHDWPAYAELTISIGEPADSVWTVSVNADRRGFFYMHVWDFDIEGGHLVTVTDGEITREHTVTLLTIIEVNVDEDTVSGTAAPDSDVQVWVHAGPSRYLTADPVGGNWTADFSDPSEDTFDLKPGSSGSAVQWDGDGNATMVRWWVPDPRFNVNPDHNSIWGWEWLPDATVAITIGDPEGPEFETTAAADQGGDFGIGTGQFDIQAGHLVTVSDGVSTRTHTVTSLTIVEINPETDAVSGTAEPFSSVWINLHNEWRRRGVTADSEGNWTADFSVAIGPETWQQAYDIRPGSHGNAHQEDEDGNGTVRQWNLPNPHFNVNPERNGIWGHEWEQGAELTVTIVYHDTQVFQTGVLANDWGRFWINTGPFDIHAGQLVTVTDGVITKTHIVTSLTITEVNTEDNTVSGTAEPGSYVRVDAHDKWRHRTVTVDSKGNWTADFSVAIGPETWQQAHDLRAGSHGNAEQRDEDGDATIADFRIPHFSVDAERRHIWGHEWPPAVELTITIGDPGSGGFQTTVPTDERGDFWVDTGSFNLQEGHLVTVTDGLITKTHIVTSLTITEINADNDTISGTADAGSEVIVHVYDDDVFRNVVADPEGNWLADFSTPVGDGHHDRAYDLGPGSHGNAHQRDEDGDGTFRHWRALGIDTDDLPDAWAGAAYWQTIEASGGIGGYTWSIIDGSLPDGLGLNPASGVISGTPVLAGVFDFTAQVDDEAGMTASGDFQITVTWPPAGPTRDLSATTVTPGELLEVTISFTSSGDDFREIILTDSAPSGWDVTVDASWAAPPADSAENPTSDQARYTWDGPHAAGTHFTVSYEVDVPVDAPVGTYTFGGSLQYQIEVAPEPPYGEWIAGPNQVMIVALIEGQTLLADSNILPGVVVTAYKNGVPLASVMSDEDGEYTLTVAEAGDLQVVASKAGFRKQTRSITVEEATTYALDFVGDDGLIPHAPDRSFVLACANRRLFWEPPYQLGRSKVLAAANARLFPITAATRTGAWADEVTIRAEPDAWQAVEKLGLGELDVFAHTLDDPALFAVVEDDADIRYKSSIGSFNTLRINPYGPEFDTGMVNPFYLFDFPEGVRTMNEVLQKFIDRAHIADDIMGGLAWPRYTSQHTQLSDYDRYYDGTYIDPDASISALEHEYRYDEGEGLNWLNATMAAIDELAPGTITGSADDGWLYNGDPIPMTVLIRSDDPIRTQIGEYVGAQLERMGFEVTHFYGDMAATLPGVANVDAEIRGGGWTVYTGGWVSTVLSRDSGYWFIYFHSNLWSAGIPAFAHLDVPEDFYDAAFDLGWLNFGSFDERDSLYEVCLPEHMKWGMFYLVDSRGFSPLRQNVDLAADRAGGIYGSWMWALTAHFHDGDSKPQVGGHLRAAMRYLLVEPWNPIAGSNTVYDMFPIRATGDMGTHPDVNTGLRWAGRIDSAEVTVKSGLPVIATNPWVTLEFEDTILAPPDAWRAWDWETQSVVTVAEALADPGAEWGLDSAEVNRYSAAYYPADIWDHPLHDGSRLSFADFLYRWILTYDRAQGEGVNPMFDAAARDGIASTYNNTIGVRFTVNPSAGVGLKVETWSQLWEMDAERMVTDWYPNYSQGNGFWHTLALAVLEERDGSMAFGGGKAGGTTHGWTNFIYGAGMLGALDSRLNTTRELTSYEDADLPYYEFIAGQYAAAGLGSFGDEVGPRMENLREWVDLRGHFWVGSGPYMLKTVSQQHKAIVLEQFAEYPDPADRWLFLLSEMENGD